MNFKKVEKDGKICAVVESDDIVILDVQSAIDLIANIDYHIGTKNIVINKNLINEDFFVLSTKLAGEILQKFVNYGVRIGIYGDYSNYNSKSLKDFIYECNKGSSVFFAQTEDEAIERIML